jgi:hypothetical protein
VASLSEIEGFQTALDDLTTLSLADLVSFWRTLDTEDAAGSAQAVREFLPDLFDTYVPLSAELGAAFYDESRDEAGARGSFIAEPVAAVDNDRTQKTVGWAIAPLFQKKAILDPETETITYTDEPDPDPKAALSRLSSASQLVVAEGARETIADNVDKDPAKPRYARHASSNACAFCALLATRGAVYRSAASAGEGRKYHSHCHCVPTAVWPSQDYEPAPYVAGWDSAYKVASKAAGKGGSKAILAHMRQSLGAA